MYSDLVLKVYPHFLNLFPKKYQPQNASQKNKWLGCLDKLERIEKIDFHKLWLVVKFIRDHEFWGVHFLTLLTALHLIVLLNNLYFSFLEYQILFLALLKI